MTEVGLPVLHTATHPRGVAASTGYDDDPSANFTMSPSSALLLRIEIWRPAAVRTPPVTSSHAIMTRPPAPAAICGCDGFGDPSVGTRTGAANGRPLLDVEYISALLAVEHRRPYQVDRA